MQNPPAPPIPSHPIVFVGLIVVIGLSIQDSYSLKQNEIFLWDVSCGLKKLELFSNDLKLI